MAGQPALVGFDDTFAGKGWQGGRVRPIQRRRRTFFSQVAVQVLVLRA